MNVSKCVTVLVGALAAGYGQSVADPESSALPTPVFHLPKLLPVSVPVDAPYKRLTLAQKYEFGLEQTVGAGAWPGLALHAALDQAGLKPAAWGSGIDSLAVRMASHFGRSFVRQNVAFLVRAADHEDPRYFRLERGTGWTRTKWAVTRTFVARKDDGSWMPAYSRFVANYSVPFVAANWGPGELPVPQGIRNGTAAFGFGAFSNVCQEFYPDLKRVLRGHPENGGLLARWRAKIR